ncbi:MAG: Hsp20/alpha crystallin family protein [Fuerstiella sp.]|nr:Hsp20/alpha crystallin family protein [Fuerstiella sp.]
MHCSTHQSSLSRPFRVARCNTATRCGGLGALTIIEADSYSRVELDVAGFSAEELSIDLQDGHLVVSGKRHQAGDCDATIYSERQSLTFRRVLRLDSRFDAVTAEAELTDGVLILTFARNREAERRRIEIQNSENDV